MLFQKALSVYLKVDGHGPGDTRIRYSFSKRQGEASRCLTLSWPFLTSRQLKSTIGSPYGFLIPDTFPHLTYLQAQRPHQAHLAKSRGRLLCSARPLAFLDWRYGTICKAGNPSCLRTYSFHGDLPSLESWFQHRKCTRGCTVC